jgi:hypothetical protein
VAWVENHSVATTPPTSSAITSTTNVALDAEPGLRSALTLVPDATPVARSVRCARRA